MVAFEKMNGAGNDFIVVDARELAVLPSPMQISQLCDRRFGVGADGLLLLLPTTTAGCHFSMSYYNSDGSEASMCGNGGRCIAYFAYCLGLADADSRTHLRFTAGDGVHDAFILPDEGRNKRVRLSMRNTAPFYHCLDGMFIDTGVPHYVQAVENLDAFDVASEGRRLRSHPAIGLQGANVDFTQMRGDGSIYVRTYERGVEGETWACGTGVTAAAIVHQAHRVVTRGGCFEVDYDTASDGSCSHVWLTGPVEVNFSGTTNII